MVATSIVRLGPNKDNVSATLLRTALVSYFQNDQTGSSTIEDDSQSTLTISNKYFTANVLLEDIGTSRSENKSSSSTTTTTNNNRKEDGIILVFDALQSNPDRPTGGTSATFDSLTLAHEETEAKDGAGELLRLCVGVTLTSPTSPEELRGQNAEKEFSRRILWCLDRGYEYIEADLSQEGQSKGHQDRDKEGFARIVEAIQGTVWSSAVMSQTKTNQLKETYQEDKTKVSPIDETDQEQEERNAYEPPDPSKWNDVAPIVGVQESSAEEEIKSMILNQETLGPQEMAYLRKDLETDQIFEKMEGLLREASRIREASKNGEMTDQERRDRASEAAMALVNIMNHFGLDHGDEGEEDGSHMDSSDDGDSGVIDGTA